MDESHKAQNTQSEHVTLTESSSIRYGLTAAEVEARVNEGLVNGNLDMPTKSVGQILKGNLFTLFNFINTLFAVLVCIVGEFKNAGFIILVVFNTGLSVYQELKAKHTIDKLSLISAPKATVIRDGAEVTIPTADIVMDDIALIRSGNQICSDCVVVEGECEVDESMLTGESDPVVKNVGDELLSGSFLVSGSVKARVVRIGVDNYAAKISNGARYIKTSRSEIQASVSSIIRLVTAIIIPMSLILFPQQIFLVNQTLPSAIVVSVTAIISMMPQGLVLLTSLVFFKSVISLAAHKTLAQDLFCVETLARVDVLCLDKTGTITTGNMLVESIDVISDKYAPQEIETLLSQIVWGIGDSNPTANAIGERCNTMRDWSKHTVVPFSSARKWSGINFETHGSFALGAAEFMMNEVPTEVTEKLHGYMAQGKRVITLVECKHQVSSEGIGDDVEVLAIIVITDQIRPEAADTLRFFADQGVSLKIISGDNPLTVSQIAARAGLAGAHDYIDASTLVDDDAIADALKKYTVFGRVTPQQKLIIVKALQHQGHTVGMTGDGVNDVLALKEADCAVAMASGSDAARTVAQLVLLDNNFASMPKVVAEGRQSINNLQRSSTLFLVKTIYATILAFLIIITNKGYPFESVQLTLISALSVGIPSILLALEPNRDIVKGKFVHNAVRNSLPFSLTILITLLSAIYIGNARELTIEQLKTLCSAVLSINMFMILFRVCLPFNMKRLLMFTLLVAFFIICYFCFQDFFSFVKFNRTMYKIFIPCLVLTYPIILIAIKFIDKFMDKRRLANLDKLLSLSNKIHIKY